MAALLGLVVVAGCVDGSPEQNLFAGDYPVSPAAPLAWAGSCDRLCDATTTLSSPAPWLTLAVSWDPSKHTGYSMVVTKPDGTSLAPNRTDAAAMVNIVPADAGTYTLHLAGSGTFSATAAAGGPGDRLPNLVTLVPTDVHVGPCYPYEAQEQGAQRCLRLSNAVGNIGPGPLEVRLATEEGLEAVTGKGTFIQRIYDDQGSYREQEVAGAEFHPTHAHFHYAGLAGFQLYEFDQATGLRGPPVGENHKSGFCFIDIGRIRNSPVQADPFEYSYEDCVVPGGSRGPEFTPELGWRMGISVGWYDLYGWDLDEQYVEISGVPDGVYELVSVADVEQTLEEAVEWDNSASVVIRLTGDRVEVLERRGAYRI